EWLAEETKKASNTKLSELDIAQIIEELNDLQKDREVLNELIAKGHNYVFIGRAGSFCPVKPGCDGGILVREKDGKFYAATGTKGYRWKEGETLKNADRMELIDMRYFESLAKTAVETIEAFGPFEQFVDEEEAPVKKRASSFMTIDEILDESDRYFKSHGEPGNPPWTAPCGKDACFDCKELTSFTDPKTGRIEGLKCEKGYDLSDYISDRLKGEKQS
ncbi:MAG: hypothetical protein J6Y48_18605, partial [Clostridia bacterium]|nr:hypothetical protein [Clostridia bacterium]